ncbi:MAG: hypothetical protein RLZZ253_3352, partial [Verrucomicrobiota bacterium]
PAEVWGAVDRCLRPRRETGKNRGRMGLLNPGFELGALGCQYCGGA